MNSNEIIPWKSFQNYCWDQFNFHEDESTKKIQRKIILGEQKKDFFFHADRKKNFKKN